MSVHARLNEPLELRKEILECAVVSTDAITYSENLKQLSRDKKKIKTQIKNGLSALKKMVKTLEKSLPSVPKEEKVQARREDMRILMQEERSEEMGGKVKPVEQIKEEIARIKGRDSKALRKKAKRIGEKESLRSQLDDIRGRIDRLGRVLPEE
jgi:chromosome segregation ATPase